MITIAAVKINIFSTITSVASGEQLQIEIIQQQHIESLFNHRMPKRLSSSQTTGDRVTDFRQDVPFLYMMDGSGPSVDWTRATSASGPRLH